MVFQRLLNNGRSFAQQLIGAGASVTYEPPKGSQYASLGEITLGYAIVGDVEIRYEPSTAGLIRVQRRTLTLNTDSSDGSYCGYDEIPERGIFTIDGEKWMPDGQPTTEGKWITFDLVRAAYREKSRREFRR